LLYCKKVEASIGSMITMIYFQRIYVSVGGMIELLRLRIGIQLHEKCYNIIMLNLGIVIQPL
jgi:hypothetical protein